MTGFAAYDIHQDLQDSPIRESWVVSGSPRARNKVLFRSTDRSAWTMLWDCSAGEFNWTYRFDETIHFLEGSVTITLPGEASKTYGPGDVIFFPAGVVAHWKIDNHIRKLAFCQDPVPAGLNPAVKLVRKMAHKLAAPAAVLLGLLAVPDAPDGVEPDFSAAKPAQIRQQA
jgi:uncharacterized cupin superfamily protein